MYTTCILEFQHLLKWSPPNLISGCSQILIKHSSKCKFYFTLPVFLSYTLTKFKPFFIHWNFFLEVYDTAIFGELSRPLRVTAIPLEI